MDFMEKKIMEMTSSKDGIKLQKLTNRSLQLFINDLLANAKEALFIYKEYRELSKVVDYHTLFAVVDGVGQNLSEEDAEKIFCGNFSIHPVTVRALVNEPFSTIKTFMQNDFHAEIEFYEEAVASLTKLAAMQAAIVIANED